MSDCKGGWHIGFPIDNHIVDIARLSGYSPPQPSLHRNLCGGPMLPLFGRFTGMTSGPDFQMNAVIGTIVRAVSVIQTDLSNWYLWCRDARYHTTSLVQEKHYTLFLYFDEWKATH